MFAVLWCHPVVRRSFTFAPFGCSLLHTHTLAPRRTRLVDVFLIREVLFVADHRHNSHFRRWLAPIGCSCCSHGPSVSTGPWEIFLRFHQHRPAFVGFVVLFLLLWACSLLYPLLFFLTPSIAFLFSAAPLVGSDLLLSTRKLPTETVETFFP